MSFSSSHGSRGVTVRTLGLLWAVAVLMAGPAASAQTRGAPAASLPKEIVAKDGAPMVLVPAGWFLMGSDDGGTDERPRRRVFLNAFYIDKYPVANAHFRKFARPAHDFGSGFDQDRQPVVGVTWFQARDYCRWAGKRLPTEAEWEKAAGGENGQLYPWGNAWDPTKVIWARNSGSGPHPVDRTYLTNASPYGAVDMEGNVWNWVADWYEASYYSGSPDRNPQGPSTGTKRTMRGCSWLSDDPWGFRVSHRNQDYPDRWTHITGFRCAAPAPSPAP